MGPAVALSSEPRWFLSKISLSQSPSPGGCLNQNNTPAYSIPYVSFSIEASGSQYSLCVCGLEPPLPCSESRLQKKTLPAISSFFTEVSLLALPASFNSYVRSFLSPIRMWDFVSFIFSVPYHLDLCLEHSRHSIMFVEYTSNCLVCFGCRSPG